jgi:GH24 family phage-related lysozyme (muramidase)
MDKIVEVLRRHEGVRSHAYKCSAGYITIGVGRNIDQDGGLGLSDDEVDYLLSNDIDMIQETICYGVVPDFVAFKELRGRLGELATTEQDLKDLLKEVSDYDE